jgi:nucleotide-binding universal stress UspA family protein
MNAKKEPVTVIEQVFDELAREDGVVPEAAGASSGGPNPMVKLQKILVPVDFSDCANEALHFALPFARQFGATLFILYVIPPLCETNTEAHGVKSTEQSLDGLVRQSVPIDIVAKTIVRAGQPADEIVRAAEEYKTDLIVISTHGYTGWKHALFGSVAERVVRHAPCPVLTVRTKMPEMEKE